MLLLIRSGEKPGDADPVFDDVYVSSSRNTLGRMIASHRTAKQFRAYAGYAGWFPGQLEREVARGDWLVISADADSIFEKKSSDLWRELFRRGSAIQVRN
jgi:putative transcriptional regulator